jgi:hypothetical protein
MVSRRIHQAGSNGGIDALIPTTADALTGSEARLYHNTNGH